MTEHDEEYLRERRAEADAGARERKAGHTQGEWRYDVSPHMLPMICTGSICIAEVWPTGGGGLEEANANALLICAAPDLLSACARAHAALDAATSILAGMDLSPGSRLDELCAELAAAREACEAALGRAEGEER
jgi:hypothetical protein